MQDVDVSTVSLFVCRRCTSSQFASYMKGAYRYKILVPMLLMCQLSAYLSAKDAPLDCSQLASYMKRVCMQKDMSTCPKAVVVSTVSIFVSMSQGFSRTIPWQTIIKDSMPYLTMANHNKSFHAIPDHEFGAPRCKTYNQSVDGGYDQSKNWKVGALRPFKN